MGEHRRRPRRRPPKDPWLATPGQHLPVGLGLVQQGLPVGRADRVGQQRDDGLGIEVLVRRPGREMPSHAPAELAADVDRLDRHLPRLRRIRRARAAERGAGHRRPGDESRQELVERHVSDGTTTHTSWPLAIAAPGATARPRTTPTRGATISFSIFIASTTQSSWPVVDVVAVSDLDLQHRALHGAHDRAVTGAAATRRHPLSATPCQLGPRRLGDEEPHVVGATVDFDPEEPRCRPRSIRRSCHTSCPMRERLLELLRAIGELLRLHDPRARLAPHEAGVLEERAVEAEQRRRALEFELRERPQHARDRAVAVDVVDDQLRDHRVVELAHLVPRLDARVDADTRAGGRSIGRDPPGRRQEPLADVLGVDPALDRVPSEHDVLLPDGERLAGGDEHLLADQVEPGDELRHGVLHLDPRVHLHEEVVARSGQQSLDGPGGAVAGSASCVDRDPADPLAERVVDGRRRGLLDELLVAALDRAVALAEVNHVAVTVREHLDLDVARILDEPLDVDRRVGEVLLTLARRGLERAGSGVRPADELHALSATPGRCLDDERVADLVAEGDDGLDGADRLDRARDDRHSGSTHGGARRRLGAHQLDRGGRRPDPREARFLDEAGKRSVLGEEAIAGVHCLGPGPERGLDEDVCAEIALGRRARADEVRLVGRARVRAPPIGLRVDGHATDPELPQGPEDPDRDLTTVRDEHLRERRGGVGRHDARILPQP